MPQNSFQPTSRGAEYRSTDARARRHLYRLAICGAVLLWAGIAATQDQATPVDEDAIVGPAPAAGGAAPDARPRAPAAAQAIPTDLFETIVAGGPVMIPIGICSVIALAFGLERMVMLRRRRVIPKDFVTRFIEHLEQSMLDRKSALKLCEENGSPVAEIFAHGVRKWGKPSVEVEQAIIDGGERQVGHLRKHLRILNAVSTVSPLLGLFGTVIGMIMCFNQIASSSAMGKAEQLAGGIGVALITTAGGLAVAIPALILYMYLIGRVDALVMEMDYLAQKVVNLISAEGLANPPSRPAPRVKPPTAAAEAKESKDAPKDTKEKKPVLG